jgi:thiol:disulfide interchange protein
MNARQFARVFHQIVFSTGTLVLAILVLTLFPSAVRGSNREIYPDPSQAHADIDAALKLAAKTHKRVLLDFGGDWCGDCQVLDLYFHDQKNLAILEAGFVLVHVNIGHMDTNLDIAQKYQVPIERGVPALAVLSDKGVLLFSQKSGEFEAMRRMESSAVTSFLVRWRPATAGCSTVMLNC